MAAFDMPTQPGGHPITGLDEACVVKATWTQIVPQGNVIRHYKRCPNENRTKGSRLVNFERSSMTDGSSAAAVRTDGTCGTLIGKQQTVGNNFSFQGLAAHLESPQHRSAAAYEYFSFE